MVTVWGVLGHFGVFETFWTSPKCFGVLEEVLEMFWGVSVEHQGGVLRHFRVFLGNSSGQCFGVFWGVSGWSLGASEDVLGTWKWPILVATFQNGVWGRLKGWGSILGSFGGGSDQSRCFGKLWGLLRWLLGSCRTPGMVGGCFRHLGGVGGFWGAISGGSWGFILGRFEAFWHPSLGLGVLGGSVLRSPLTPHLPTGSGMPSPMASPPGGPPGLGCSLRWRPPTAPTPRYGCGSSTLLVPT